MLELMSFYSGWDLELTAKGDLQTGMHHTLEDTGLAIGKALDEALGPRTNLMRFADLYQPMDATLVQIVFDLATRINLVYNLKSQKAFMENIDLELFNDFFKALVQQARLTLHINEIYSDNGHHLIEAIFKGFGRGFKAAATLLPENKTNSTKGVL
jgi:imidazoleglycerol-phosphate dehydratase